MKKLSFLIAIFAIFLPFSASFASNLFTLSEINIPKIITIDEQSKYSAS